MASLEHSAKLRWHMDIVAHPKAHAWGLGLYRAGERHPETVTDYFPHRHAREHWPELADQLKRHAGDERGHVVLYTKAIERMGETVSEVEPADVFNQTIRAQTPVSWAIADDDARDVKRLKLAHFLAHAHQLERRVGRSLDYHLEACARLGRHEVASVVERVHADEARHIRTSFEALSELTTPSERAELIALHARSEARADRAFSVRQVRVFLGLLGRTVPLSRRLFYAASAFVMEQSHA